MNKLEKICLGIAIDECVIISCLEALAAETIRQRVLRRSGLCKLVDYDSSDKFLNDNDGIIQNNLDKRMEP